MSKVEQAGFSPRLQEEASRFSIPSYIFHGRKEVKGVSIDGSKHPHEIDDAVWFEKDGQDIRVQVHIVDLSALLVMGSAMDMEAYDRAFTRYFPHYTHPMLPPEFTSKAGLKKGQKVPTITYGFTVGNAIGEKEISFTWLMNRDQLTFHEVNRIIKTGGGPYAEMLRVAALATEGMQSERVAKGGRSWLKEHFPECFNQEIDWFHSGDAYRIVQESMLMAGGMTARHFLDEGTPGLFRVFPSPDGLPKSSYSSIPGEHQGVKMFYTHATSPLRRDADIVVQRQLAADIFLNINPPYDQGDMTDKGQYFTEVNRQFLMRLEAGQRKFSKELDDHLAVGKIGNGFKEKALDRITAGKVTKYDVFKILAQPNGHGSNFAEVQIAAFDWLKARPHFLNDFINFVKEGKRWSYPNYFENDGHIVAAMKVNGDRTITSQPVVVNGDHAVSRKNALLSLLESELGLEVEAREKVVFPS